MNQVDRNTFRGARSMPGNYYARSSCAAERTREGCGCDPCEQQRNVCPRSSCAAERSREGCGCDPCEQKRDVCPRSCDQRGSFDQSFALAMAYVPFQEWNGISSPCDGLANGTVFYELVKPFCGAGRRKS